MQFANRIFIRGMLLLAPILFSACGGGGSGASGTTTTPPAASGTARAYAYVADDFASTVTSYRVSATGDLTELGSVAARGLPEAVIVHPGGKYVYVTNTKDPGFSAYRIDPATGGLILLGVADPPGAWPAIVAVNPGGSFLYLTNNYAHDDVPSPPPQVPQEIATYRIDPGTGQVTLAGTLVIGRQIYNLVVPPHGDVAYLSTYASSTAPALLSAYALDPVSGSLTLLAEVSAAGNLAAHPQGRYAFVASTSGEVSVYKLDPAARTLTQVGAAVSTGTQPSFVAVHPGGNFVYVTANQTVRTYRFDVATGALVPSTTFVPAGGGPHSGAFGAPGMPLAFDPSGKFAYVSASGSILICGIDPVSGALTQVGTSAARSQYALAIATAGVVDPTPTP